MLGWDARSCEEWGAEERGYRGIDGIIIKQICYSEKGLGILSIKNTNLLEFYKFLSLKTLVYVKGQYF